MQVSVRLAARDRCGAHEAAAGLQRTTIAQIDRVPPALQERLQSGVNDLVSRLPACAPPQPHPPDVMHASDNAKRAKAEKHAHGEHGHGHGHKHGEEGD